MNILKSLRFQRDYERSSLKAKTIFTKIVRPNFVYKVLGTEVKENTKYGKERGRPDVNQGALWRYYRRAVSRLRTLNDILTVRLLHRAPELKGKRV